MANKKTPASRGFFFDQVVNLLVRRGHAGAHERGALDSTAAVLARLDKVCDKYVDLHQRLDVVEKQQEQVQQDLKSARALVTQVQANAGHTLVALQEAVLVAQRRFMLGTRDEQRARFRLVLSADEDARKVQATIECVGYSGAAGMAPYPMMGAALGTVCLQSATAESLALALQRLYLLETKPVEEAPDAVRPAATCSGS